MLLRAGNSLEKVDTRGNTILKGKNLRSKYRPTCLSAVSGIGTQSICKTPR